MYSRGCMWSRSVMLELLICKFNITFLTDKTKCYILRYQNALRIYTVLFVASSCDWRLIDGKGYFESERKVNFTVAKEKCKARNSTLLYLETYEEIIKLKEW